MKSIKNWFPIKSIEDGIIKTKTGKYCKVLEVYPVNFELKSSKKTHRKKRCVFILFSQQKVYLFAFYT